MAIQIGTVDGLVNITEEKIRCFVNAIESFSHGGIEVARNNGVSLGAAFQRFVEPVYTKAKNDFDFSDITKPVYTKGGKEQSPARVTFCKKMGLLNIDDVNEVFELTPLSKELYNGNITVEEYAFVLLTKQGIFKDGKFVYNLFSFISEWFDCHTTISETELLDAVKKRFNDSSIEKTRADIIVNALEMCGLLSNVATGKYVLSNLQYADIFKDFKANYSNLSNSLRDDETGYIEYIGSLEKGVFDILTSQNSHVYLSKYPNLSRYINEKNSTDSSQIKKQIPMESFVSSSNNPLITALRTKPFLLLAGISGTGKSRIVRELARACWEKGTDEYKAHKPRNFEMVQVKPNWHDSSELIGYVSRIGDKPEFIAGDFLKFVVKAWGEPDIPYFLCLDEMNLAPVEQYFAEYLSVIESRKLEEGIIVTDPLLKGNKSNYPEDDKNEDWYYDLTDYLTSSFGRPDNALALKQKFLNEGITIPQNLFVIGTVNMDETTFSFSRKVLDRAMTIEMNDVDLTGGLEKDAENEFGYIGKGIMPFAVEGKDVYSKYKTLCDNVLSFLTKINSKLDKTPFKIAYRTRNEFLVYAVCRGENKLLNTLDEMTSMKILSRIEGDADKTERVLNDLESLLKEQLKDLEKSISLEKIVEMKEKLNRTQYTSFWS